MSTGIGEVIWESIGDLTTGWDYDIFGEKMWSDGDVNQDNRWDILRVLYIYLAHRLRREGFAYEYINIIIQIKRRSEKRALPEEGFFSSGYRRESQGVISGKI